MDCSNVPPARLWWNWQTRYFEVVVPQGVQVQILLSAPYASFFRLREQRLEVRSSMDQGQSLLAKAGCMDLSVPSNDELRDPLRYNAAEWGRRPGQIEAEIRKRRLCVSRSVREASPDQLDAYPTD